MTKIVIFAFSSVCRNLERFLIYKNGNSTVFNACIYRASEDSFYLLRKSGCGYIPIVRRSAENAVSYAAADSICLEAVSLQIIYYEFNILGKINIQDTFLLF